MRLLLKDGLSIAMTGLAVGLVLAALATPALALFLAGVSPHDVTSFVLVAVVVALTALAAAYGPARRATRLAPMDALRNE